MSTNNTPQTPARIALETQLKFRIPLYQRPYAWTTTQVELLLEDLWNSFKKGRDINYHIGIMSVADSGDGSGTWDIIDGQQRMTTLMLIGKAAESYAPIWKDFLINDRLALYGRTTEQAILRNPQYDQKSVMGRAFLCAKEFLSDRPKEFSEFIFKRAAFFVSKAPLGYSVVENNQQFVRLNNRGKQLEKHEILKVRLSSMIKDSAKQSIFMKQWNGMLECLSEQQVTNSDSEIETATLAELLEGDPSKTESAKERLYSAIVSVPVFLLIALARTEKGFDVEMNPDILLETFSRLEDLDPERVVRFGVVLEKQTSFLRKFFIFTTKSGRTAYELGLGEWEKNSEVLDSTVKKDTADVFDALIMTQSFLYVSTEPRDWLIPAFNWCEAREDQGKSIDPSDFKDELEKMDFEIQSQKKPLPALESMEFGRIPHYWFYRLDYELWKSYRNRGKVEAENDIWTSLRKEAEELVKGFQFRKCASVEHINPQNPKEGEADPAVNLFGNLALISGSRNSAFSNETRAGKQQMILDSKYTESLKMVHFLWCNENTVETGKNMYSLLADSLKQEG